MKDLHKEITIVTSLNTKLLKMENQMLLGSMNIRNPEIPLWVYHENSYDEANFGEKIGKLPENCKGIDLFKCWEDKTNDNLFPFFIKNGWLEKFVHGSDSVFEKSKSKLPAFEGWNMQAKYWFRKVAAYYHASKTCNTRYLLWLDCDIDSRFSDEAALVFYNFIQKYDLCYIDRSLRQRKKHLPFPGSPPDTGVICFDLKNQRVLNLIEHVFNLFVTGSIFKEDRWDDTWALGLALMQYKEKLNLGIFSNKHSPRRGNISGFEIFSIFKHLKNNQKDRLSEEEFNIFSKLGKRRRKPPRKKTKTNTKMNNNPSRYNYLTEYITNNDVKVIIEIGTWKGITADRMIECATKKHKPEEVYYYGFDVWEGMNNQLMSKEFSKKPCTELAVMNKFKQTAPEVNIELMKGLTSQTLPKFVEQFDMDADLIYIDGGHSIETVQNDWDYISKIANEDTVIFFDDYYELHSGKRPTNGCNRTIHSIDRKIWNVEILPNYSSHEVCKGGGEGRDIYFVKVTKK